MNTAEKAAFAKRVAAEVFGPDALALLSKELPCSPGTRGHAITRAENSVGETIGKRDPGPWIDWTLIERAKRWNDRVYGREAVQPDAAPKRRSMTDAQRACLRGDV